MTDKAIKLSIIIPMYNSEDYISECLDSIINSDLPKVGYEVIIVNDGSKDKSPQIAQEYVSRNDNFRYFTQDNQGQSVARNYGIREANGEYIWFVDSDDLVCEDVGYIYKFLENHPDADIIKTYIREFQKDEQKQYIQKDLRFSYSSGRDLMVKENFHPSSVCELIISKKLLINNNLFFVPNLVHQDVELSARLYSCARHVYTVNFISYLYRYNMQSTTRSINPTKILRQHTSDVFICKCFHNEALQYEVVDPELSDYFLVRAKQLQFGIILNLLRYRWHHRNNGVSKIVLQELKNNNLYPIKPPFISFSKKIFAKVVNIEWLLRVMIR